MKQDKDHAIVMPEQLTEREQAYMALFDEVTETHNFTPAEEYLLMQFATNDQFIHSPALKEAQQLSDVEVSELSDTEYSVFINRLRAGIKRILMVRARYIAGPYVTNRHYREGQFKKMTKTLGRKNPFKSSTIPSVRYAGQLAKRQAMKNLNLYNALPSRILPKVEDGLMHQVVGVESPAAVAA